MQRHHHFYNVEAIDHLHDLGRSEAADDAHDGCARNRDVHQHAGDGEGIRGHRPFGSRNVDGAASDETVQEVEFRLGLAVQFDDPPILDLDLRFWVGRAVEQDQAGFRPFLDKAIAIDLAVGAGLKTQ